MSGNGSWLTVPRRSSRKGRARPKRTARRWLASFTSKSASRKWNWIFWHASSVTKPGGEVSNDRQTEQAPVVNPAMPAAGAQSLVAVLSAGNRQYGRPGADGADRPPVPGDAVLRLAQDDGLAAPRGPCRQPQAGLMRQMGLQVIWQKPNTSQPNPEHKTYPYLLRGLTIDRPNQVWATDITYIPMPKGFFYLVAIMDWHSRKVLSWRLSNTMAAIFCVEALEEALALYGRPEIFNSDQGAQFTSTAFTGVLEAAGVRISMDGKGRCMDNVFVERLWRSLKYEDIYLRAYATGSEARLGIGHWIAGSNTTRPHQALGYRTPDEVYRSPPIAGLAPTPIGVAA